MNTFLKTAACTVMAMIGIAACGNAGASNGSERKEDKNVQQAAVTELDSKGFNTKVYDLTLQELKYLGDKPAIVDFTASWCGPCQRIAPILEELAKEYEGKIVIYKVDIDKERGLAQAFNVSSVPSVLFIPGADADPVMTVGARDKGTFKKEIDTILLGK